MNYMEIEKQDQKNKEVWDATVSHVQRLTDAEFLLRKVHYHLLSQNSKAIPKDLSELIDRYYMGD